MKIAVVTGASSGIGADAAHQLIAQNWKVYGISRNQPNIKHDNFTWLAAVLTKIAEVTNCLAQIREPTIDLLLSNAGIAFTEPASQASQQSYHKMFDLNVLAPMLLVNQLRAKITHATIITISSVSDRIVEKDFALYCASKAANTRYFESLADELKQAKVFSLLPDYVDTPMLHEVEQADDFDWLAPLKPAAITELIMKLIAGIHIGTGANIIIVNNAMAKDLQPIEKLYGYNADTKKLDRL